MELGILAIISFTLGLVLTTSSCENIILFPWTPLCHYRVFYKSLFMKVGMFDKAKHKDKSVK